MRVRIFIQTTFRSLGVLFICSFMYVQFLATPIPHFLSMKEWSIIGFIRAAFDSASAFVDTPWKIDFRFLKGWSCPGKASAVPKRVEMCVRRYYVRDATTKLLNPAAGGLVFAYVFTRRSVMPRAVHARAPRDLRSPS